MTPAAVGTAEASFSVAVMPSMPGMLMSIRTTSGLTAAAISRASGPLAAAPTTSTSASKPSSFERWSRVSGMSSTIRTLMRSAIVPLGSLLRRRQDGLDELGRQDPVLVDEGLEDHAVGDLGEPGVFRRAQDDIERAGGPAEQQDLRLGRRDREDQQRSE